MRTCWCLFANGWEFVYGGFDCCAGLWVVCFVVFGFLFLCVWRFVIVFEDTLSQFNVRYLLLKV